MKTKYCKHGIETKQTAMLMAQRMTRQHAEGDKQVFAIVEGPEAGFSVVDIKTAIELGLGYSW